jgi:hypothetical protein
VDGSDGVGGGTALVVNLDNPANDILAAGQFLGPNDFRKSPSGGFVLIMQGDSNLVLYTADFKAHPWDAGTENSGARFAIMQLDGNLCIRPTLTGQEVFCSGTYGHPGAYLRVTDDGHVVIQDGNFEIWRKP